MSEQLLEVKEIYQRFSKRILALENISFRIKKGEVIALLGDNGAGKSTLIKLLSGYYCPTSGDILWEGKKLDWNKKSSTRLARAVGIQTVYQDLGLIEQLSVLRNFFLGNELTKGKIFPVLDFAGMAAVVEEQLEQMAIKRKIDPFEQVSCLSGGERQVLAISRAVYFKSKLLIMDEPTSALSLKQRKEVYASVRKAAASGIAVIYITHSLDSLSKLVDRYLILNHGRLVGDYDVKAVSDRQLEELITK
ncbi:ATP-binding cassette domain-containing protein [Lentisphaerota bacterium ZTH]|nr:sugar ABC transporter ATP-binding protein [Lentisphaerota bacterium]WET07258.1 ATP-binding cassette domain-containing protein [Lentisphaerota bacterium ZTH]